MFRRRKKLLSVLLGCALLLGSIGTSSAALYTDAALLLKDLTDTGSTSWQHVLPAAFSMPSDDVDYASMTILRLFYEGGNNRIVFEGTNLGSRTFFRQNFDMYTHLTPISMDDGIQDIRANYHEGYFFNDALLTFSTLLMKWADRPSLTPEPGTLALLGAGLIGLVYLGKKNRFKKGQYV